MGKNGSIRSGDFFLSPILATQEVRLPRVGGHHQEIDSTNHYAHIRKKIQTLFFLPFTEQGKLLLYRPSNPEWSPIVHATDV